MTFKSVSVVHCPNINLTDCVNGQPLTEDKKYSSVNALRL